MKCPYCDHQGNRPEIHAHLTDGHIDQVHTRTAGSGRRFYEFDCPFCDQSHIQEIKPRNRDPGFMEEYAREIRIVAFDLMLHHIHDAHEEVLRV